MDFTYAQIKAEMDRRALPRGSQGRKDGQKRAEKDGTFTLTGAELKALFVSLKPKGKTEKAAATKAPSNGRVELTREQKQEADLAYLEAFRAAPEGQKRASGLEAFRAVVARVGVTGK